MRSGAGKAQVKGERHGGAKLTEDDVRAIRAKRKTGVKLRYLAAEYGVSISTIQQAASSTYWTHVK